MKRIFTLATGILAAALVCLSCGDAKYGVITNAVYIDEAAPADRFTQQVETVTMNGTFEKTMSIRLMNYAEQDVTVTLDVDEEFISDYNKRKNASYEVLPEQYWTMDRTVKIAAGSLSNQFNLRIEPFEATDGKTFALPIRISSVEGPVEALSDARHLMFLFATPLIQRTPIFFSGNAGSGGAFETKIENLDNLTLEFWMRMGNIYGGQAFNSNSSPLYTGNFLFRWWPRNTQGDGPWFQNEMSYAHLDDLTHPWVAEKWFHIAYTFDGNDMILYINGEKEVSMNLAGHKYSFGNMIFVNNNYTFGQNSSLAQIRLWDKCLSQGSIRDNMSREVPSNSSGLRGYWKLDKEEDGLFKDSTGNGNDLPIKGTLQWSDPINFLNPNSSTGSDE